MVDINASLIILAIFFTIVLVTGIYSSWEYAAILAAAFTILPLFLFPSEYIEFLKVLIFDMEVLRFTNFTTILFFDSVVIAYAFNAWIRMFFIVLFIAVIAWKLGFITPSSIPVSIGA